MRLRARSLVLIALALTLGAAGQPQVLAQHGLAMVDASTPLASPLMIAAGWDTATARSYGLELARQARGSGASVAAVALDRFGSEPLLSQRVAATLVRAMQHAGVIAAAFPGTGHGTVRALREAEWPPLRSAIVDGGVGAVTCVLRDGSTASFCQNRKALATMLTRDVRFEGFVIGTTGDLASASRVARTVKRIRAHAKRPPNVDGDTLSRHFVQNGAVLLRNDGNVLPFDPKMLTTLGAIGADGATLAALRAAFPSTRVVEIGASDPGAAAAAAKTVRACAIVLGPNESAEDGDLVRAVVAANPLTAVVLEREPAAAPAWATAVPALLLAWNPVPGTPGAVANLLAGIVAPSGHLPAPLSGVGATSGFSLGAGLSYTTFAYSGLRVTYAHGAHPVTISFVVRNTGKRSGTAVPELYLRLPPAAQELDARLAGFTRVALAPGHSRRVSFPLTVHSFAYWSPGYHAWFVAPGSYRAEAGSSQAEATLTGTVRIVAR